MSKGWHWLKAGMLMGILNAVLLIFYGKLLGASTAYVSVIGGLLRYVTPSFVAQNPYFKQTPLGMTFEVALLLGVVLGAHLAFRSNNHVKEEFSSVWFQRFGPNKTKRYIFAFFGGVLLIFGARLAGGCTSGHVLSGWSQLSVSSLLFGLGMFAAGLPTARLLFRRQKLS
ncbi:YeeE/YedE family protein [Thermanaerosceptrum fracticalcis]|uniref:YeeE/YedE family protein n=1 Tax=Thermanaerosceptrum fracticalcis TaxID=1712410 RepID=A0A7G6E5F6_THEFR|nr:YeeE/YedE thiosulfate transporter family protein [Thermanaerosceptrum fracticalcis]QNB47310.1 YeeE/YedE family protein [Thermanaerosceptrum fracticalcis]